MPEEARPRGPTELADALHSRVHEGAGRYLRAVMRYLVRPPLSLKIKYATFLVDFAQQGDHIVEVLARAAGRVRDPLLAEALRKHSQEERQRTQLVLSDLRRLGLQKESLPHRPMAAGDAALRGYSTTLSYERPIAVLGMLLTFIGVAAYISPNIVRLLQVGGVPKEAMRWLLLRESNDNQAFAALCRLVAERLGDGSEQLAVLESIEVSAELLALGAAGRKPLS